MVRPIVHDPVALARPSSEATVMDLNTVQDLKDTLSANAERCVGMAANMIGVHKRILVFSVGPMAVAMINPVIVKKSGEYETEEGCLSLTGVRSARRYSVIEVEYFDEAFSKRRGTFRDLTAQIIQHEMDHFEGILI